MSLRLVLGRAGSGKTYRCLEQIRQRLRQDAVAGARLLFLVPEQASFQMERALIETPDIAGYARCEVLSFRRLAFRIFAEAGTGAGRGDETIGNLGRLMLIRRILRHERPTLELLGRVADKPGLVRQVAGAIEELMREQVAPATLAEAAGRVRVRDPLQSAKLGDLSRLYRAYLDALTSERLDPGQYLSLAAERAAGCAWLDGAEIWVDGFAGFTAQEYTLLCTLARRAATMEITFLVEPSTPALTLEQLGAWHFSLFSRTERSMVRLRAEMNRAGLVLDKPVLLPDQHRTRFRDAELARLEKWLFVRAQPRGDVSAIIETSGEGDTSALLTPPLPPLVKGGRADAARPTTQTEEASDVPLGAHAGLSAGEPQSSPAVSVIEVPDRRTEVDVAVEQIERLRRESVPPMRYRDIAVIVRDLGPYHDLLSAAMKAHHIPCFIDRRLPTTQHPLVECVRGLLAIAEDNCSLESVRLLLKTGLLPIAANDADLLENYLLACGIRGRAAWDEPWHFTRYFQRHGPQRELTSAQQTELDRINATRRQWLAAVSDWLTASAGQELDGRAWATALFNCLEHLGAGGKLQAWATAAESAGRPDEAEASRQVWSDFVDLLDEFVRALGGEQMKIGEFKETIEAGLAEFTLGLAPATLDEVLVGAIERSRHPPVRAVLLLGFDDAHFPLRRGEDPLLGDDERESLAAAQAEIGPPRRQQLLDERMLAYIALTRASERVIISYPRAEADGKPVNASTYLRDILAALPGLEVQTIAEPRGGRSWLGLTRLSEVGARLAREFRYRPELDQETDLAGRARWNAIYAAARANAPGHDCVGRALSGLSYLNAARLSDGLITKAVGNRLAASVSRLELFAACPFAHYVEYLLKLEPRMEADMRAVDIGTLAHAILEKFIGELATAKRSLGELEDDAIDAGVASAAEAIIPVMRDELMLTEARNAFLVDRGRQHLGRVLRWQRDSARVGAFRPLRVEYDFGFVDVRENSVTLTTPKGRQVYLRGRIDRVDVAELAAETLGVVIDYKHSTARTLDLAKAYYGLALQLVGYLLALRQTGESAAGRPIRPVAALYLPLLEPYKAVAHPSEVKDRSYQWRGLADASALTALDHTVQPGGGSKFLAARLTKEGTPYAASDLATQDDFKAVIAHTAARMGHLADALLDGKIEVDPYRLRRHMPCAWCPYRAVCRHEIETQPPRTLPAMRKSEALELMRKEVRA